MRKLFLAAAAATAMISSAATAAVTYDPATGGFAGKGDVQTAFGWNNAQLQLSAASITFRWGSSSQYEVVCTWVTNPTRNPVTHTVTSIVGGPVGATVQGTSRTGPRDQVTGFTLDPLGTSSGTAPYLGQSCSDAGADGNGDGQITSVTPLGGGSGGGLYVSDGTTEVLLLPAS